MNILRGSMALEWLTAWTTPVWDHPTKGMAHFAGSVRVHAAVDE